VSKCAHCRGAGTVICPRCSGTKSLRKRPAQLRLKDLDLLDAPGD
jgi:DnaJ-class molecular chaperone